MITNPDCFLKPFAEAGSDSLNQQFLCSTLTKIREARELINRVNPNCDLEVDGGIDASTARLAFEAGANVFVAGTSVGMRSLAEALNPQLQLIS